MAKKSTPRTFALLAALPGQVVRLVKAEIGNAKNEVSGRIRNLIIAIALVVAVLIILFWTIAVLLVAAIAGISEALPVWLSALIVAGGGILVMAILAIVAVALFKRGSPVPAKTLARIQGDLDAAGEVKDVTNQYKAQPGKKGTEPGKNGVWQ